MKDYEDHRWRVKNGQPAHDEECYFPVVRICTCGLLHHLEGLKKDLSDDLEEELIQHHTQVNLSPKPLPRRTKEELKKDKQRLDEIHESVARVFREERTEDE